MVVVKRVSLLVQVLTITDKSNLRKMHDFVNNLEKIPGKCTVSGKKQ